VRREAEDIPKENQSDAGAFTLPRDTRYPLLG
jgi:hypothetical protein